MTFKVRGNIPLDQVRDHIYSYDKYLKQTYYDITDDEADELLIYMDEILKIVRDLKSNPYELEKLQSAHPYIEALRKLYKKIEKKYSW